MTEKEERAEAFAAMKRHRGVTYERPTTPKCGYRTAGSDRRSGYLSGRKGNIADSIVKGRG